MQYVVSFKYRANYNSLTEVYGGTYAKELYEAFALAWKAFKVKGLNTEDLLTTVDETPALARFLAECYCDIAVKAQQIANEAEVEAQKAPMAAKAAEGARAGLWMLKKRNRELMDDF